MAIVTCRPGKMPMTVKFLIFTLAIAASASAFGDGTDMTCDYRASQWLDPAIGKPVTNEALFARLAETRIVLLGEEHTNADHHRWQSYVLSALHGRNANLSVGFEMLPRRVQPALDAWSEGTLSAKEFLSRTEWQKVWGYDAELYLPLLHFARINRLPAIALNVERELVSQVGSEGWQSVPLARREGVSNPAPASDAYREQLARLYAVKQAMKEGQAHAEVAEPDDEALAEIKSSNAFTYFVEAQLTWDRAMAEALAEGARRDPDAQIVGIVGRGHLEHGYGIPHQLADLGIEKVAVLLPMDAREACAGLAKDLASGVFLIGADDDATAARPRPRLGVVIEAGDDGVVVLQVIEDSVAAESGMLTGDVIQTAAGFDIHTPAELIAVVTRQAPGTWLPLRIRRDAETHDLIARFPQQFEPVP